MESTYTNKPTYKIAWICDPMSSDFILSEGYYQLVRLSDNAILFATSSRDFMAREVANREIKNKTYWE